MHACNFSNQTELNKMIIYIKVGAYEGKLLVYELAMFVIRLYSVAFSDLLTLRSHHF